MSDGPCLSLHDTPALQDNLEYVPPPETPTINLTTVSLWIDDQPLATCAGLLELIGNALYRHGRFAEGNEIKHIVSELRA